MIDRLAIVGYRSIRSIILSLGTLNVLTGPNGTQAAEQSQVIVVTHNQKLVERREANEDCVPIRLKKRLGETVIEDANLLDQYGWNWRSR